MANTQNISMNVFRMVETLCKYLHIMGKTIHYTDGMARLRCVGYEFGVLMRHAISLGIPQTELDAWKAMWKQASDAVKADWDAQEQEDLKEQKRQQAIQLMTDFHMLVKNFEVEDQIRELVEEHGMHWFEAETFVTEGYKQSYEAFDEPVKQLGVIDLRKSGDLDDLRKFKEQLNREIEAEFTKCDNVKTPEQYQEEWNDYYLDAESNGANRLQSQEYADARMRGEQVPLPVLTIFNAGEPFKQNSLADKDYGYFTQEEIETHTKKTLSDYDALDYLAVKFFGINWSELDNEQSGILKAHIEKANSFFKA